MIFSGHRILERIAAPLADSLGLEDAFDSAALNGYSCFLESHDGERGSEQLPRHAAQLASENLSERVDLFVGRGGIDDEDAFAVALVDRLGPMEDGRTFNAGQAHLAAGAAGCVNPDKGPAASIL